MYITELTPRLALDKGFLRIKPTRLEIDQFRDGLTRLFDQVKNNESEEYHKNLISEFLATTYYKPGHFINTKEQNDLVIHSGSKAESPVGVIFEVKKPSNKNEMVSADNLNTKAFQELVLYYLRERVKHENIHVKHLIITNVDEWYIFDAAVFEQHFFQNKEFLKHFNDFEAKRLLSPKTDFFYTQIAKSYIATLNEIELTHFNLRDYESIVRASGKENDVQLIPLYKILSPEHLLKLPFANDSNTLDTGFYNELLYILGLTEVKRDGKVLIERCAEKTRNSASILEETMNQLDSYDILDRLKNPEQYGSTNQERLFSVALELSITWINRILFIKLLEAQLLAVNYGDKDFWILHAPKIKNYDELEDLFFQVLAKKPEDRNEDVKELFRNTPYLNSSLFEPTELERQTIHIKSLTSSKAIPFFSSTLLKDAREKKRTGSLPTPEYLLEFLNAYDFGSAASEEIQEDSKPLINAAVLGLIFEKINGYKDGSFFTPGYITMSMCRETIRRAVVQKFNDVKNWHVHSIEDIRARMDYSVEMTDEANAIINSIKICDPAVGSGHFLVSVLNEIIAVKSDLGILKKPGGRRVSQEYRVQVVNDELIITDRENGKLYEYRRKNLEEKSYVQKTLFYEKQTLIENCLFGVDINPNSVQICRLRLWIELLKNAYYNADGSFETLPNLDINIKCGNSLISRFPVDTDITPVLKKHDWTIERYRSAVASYRNAKNREQKKEITRLIANIKSDIQNEMTWNIPQESKRHRLEGELYRMTHQSQLLERSPKEEAEWKSKSQRITEEIAVLETEVAEIKSNKIFANAFEWRFEFPEVLSDNGEFLGFDVVIGNPPYGVKYKNGAKEWFKRIYSDVHVRTLESYNYFVKLYSMISGNHALCCFIIPSSFLSQAEFEKARELILTNYSPYLILNLGDAVFGVTVPTCIVGFDKLNKHDSIIYDDLSAIERKERSELMNRVCRKIKREAILDNQFHSFVYQPHSAIIEKCYRDTPALKQLANEITTGASSGLDSAFVVLSKEARKLKLENKLVKKLVIGGEIHRFYIQPESEKKLIYLTAKDNIEQLPNVKNHLNTHKEKLMKRKEVADGLRVWYSFSRPRRKEIFEQSKILIRQTANRIMASFDDEKWYCLKSGIIVQLPNEEHLSYKYLLGLLNSSLMDFLYKNLVNESNRVFPEVKPVQLAKLPIKLAPPKIQRKVETLVHRIIAKKAKAPQADTADLEAGIDKLVYAIYELTPDEIEVIENH